VKRTTQLISGALISVSLFTGNIQSASAMQAVTDGGGSPTSAIQNFFDNPFVSAGSNWATNRVTLTPTVGSAVAAAVKDSGGIAQVIPTAAILIRIYSPIVLMGTLEFLTGMANG
jgi:hypothetical protein